MGSIGIGINLALKGGSAGSELLAALPSTLADVDVTQNRSYDGSSQFARNMASGDGWYDFTLGNNDLVNTDDPTPNGTPGTSAFYLGLDGGDFLRIANPQGLFFNEDFTQTAYWNTGTGTIVSLGGATPPAQYSECTKVIATSATGTKHVYQQCQTLGGDITNKTVYVRQVVKQGEYSWCFPRVVDGTGTTHYFGAFFDIANGVAGNNNNNGEGSLLTKNIYPHPQDPTWFVIEMSGIIRTTATTLKPSFLCGMALNGSTTSFTGDDTSGFYATGVQMSVGQPLPALSSFKTVRCGPDFLDRLHRLGQPYWTACAFNPGGNVSQFIFGNNTASGNPGFRSAISSVSTWQPAQRGDAGNGTPTQSLGAIANGTDYLSIFSFDGVGNKRAWLNSRTKQEAALTFAAATLKANGRFSLMGGPTGGPFTAGTKFYAFSAGNAYIDDAQAAKIFDIYNARHGRVYA